ncbi:hypothetical protein CMV_019416 [Castanea mollissima]|uniref:Uncharacterized protein n=1 Tax=Castanea mollissima TaxID=60419 RepID=A0A8J4VGQ0_9ROSI|nr:hypothetical protein CMV_019416 [Castanea mollissima]
MGFDDGGLWVLTTVEISVGFDKIGVDFDNDGDRWVARLVWRRSVGGEFSGLVMQHKSSAFTLTCFKSGIGAKSSDLCANPFLTFPHLPAYPTPTSPPPPPPLPPISNLRSSRRRQRSLLLDPTFLILRSEGF